MGTEIDLRLGGLVVDWAKNSAGADHGVLFQDSDRKLVPYENESGVADAEQRASYQVWERAFGRSLRSTVPRLELLGYTLPAARTEYERHMREWLEYHDHPTTHGPQLLLSFDEFLELVGRHPVGQLDDTFDLIDAGPKRQV